MAHPASSHRRFNGRRVLDPAKGLFQAVASLPPPHEQVAFMQAGGAAEFAKPWNSSFSNLTVRQILDEIAEHIGKGRGWTLSGANDFRVVQFHLALAESKLDHKSP